MAQTAYNRRIAARTEVAATQAAFESDKVPLDLFLEAQRRQADAESGFFAALVEYALAMKNLHLRQGFAARLQRNLSGRRPVAG